DAEVLLQRPGVQVVRPRWGGGHAAVVWLDRPHKLNALGTDVLAGLADAFEWLQREDFAQGRLKVVALLGKVRAARTLLLGFRSFSAGADLKEEERTIPSMTEEPSKHEQSMFFRKWRFDLQVGRRAMQAIQDIEAFTICGVHGHAMGGGWCLALASDLVIAEKDTVFAMPEIDIHLPLTWACTPRLVQHVGTAKAKEIIALGLRYRADELAALGAINRVVESKDAMQDLVREWATQLAAKDPFALHMVKTQFRGLARAASMGDMTETDGDLLLGPNHTRPLGTTTTRSCSYGNRFAMTTRSPSMPLMRLHTVCLGFVGDCAITMSPLPTRFNSGAMWSTSTISPAVLNVGSIDGPTHIVTSNTYVLTTYSTDPNLVSFHALYMLIFGRVSIRHPKPCSLGTCTTPRRPRVPPERPSERVAAAETSAPRPRAGVLIELMEWVLRSAVPRGFSGGSERLGTPSHEDPGGTAAASHRLPTPGEGAAACWHLARFKQHGEAFGLTLDDFESISGLPRDDAKSCFEAFDTDKNGRVDALETLSAIALMASVPLTDKLRFVYDLYDVGKRGALTLDEVAIAFHGILNGFGKMDGRVPAIPIEQLEAPIKRIFLRVGKTVDDEVTFEEFTLFCKMHSLAQSVLAFINGAAGLEDIPPGVRFEDPSFDSIAQVLYGPQAQAPEAAQHTIEFGDPANFVWKRPGSDPLVLLPDDLVASRLCRGYFPFDAVADALQMLAMRPRLVQALFLNTGQESQGRFTMQFFSHGQWQIVSVDDRVLCSRMARFCTVCESTQEPGRELPFIGFCHAVDHPAEIWMHLLEKGLAKLHGSYAALGRQSFYDILESLTGGVAAFSTWRTPSEEHLRAAEEAKIYQTLSTAYTEGVVGVAHYGHRPEGAGPALDPCEQFLGHESRSQRKGIAPAQLYTVHGVKSGFVKLRAPKSTSKHRYTAHEEHDQKCSEDESRLGLFWMAFRDFVAIFHDLHMCRVFDEAQWSACSVTGSMVSGGLLTDPAWYKNDQHCLQVLEPDSTFHVSVFGCLPEQQGTLSLCVFAHDYGNVLEGDAIPVTAVTQANVQAVAPIDMNKHSASLKLTLQPGKYVVAVLDQRMGSSSRYSLVVRHRLLAGKGSAAVDSHLFHAKDEVDFVDRETARDQALMGGGSLTRLDADQLARLHQRVQRHPHVHASGDCDLGIAANSAASHALRMHLEASAEGLLRTMGAGASTGKLDEVKHEYLDVIAKAADADEELRKDLLKRLGADEQTGLRRGSASSVSTADSLAKPQTTIPIERHEVGESNTTTFRVQARKDGKPLSLWHDVPLFEQDDQGQPNKDRVHFVCEIPKWTKKKFEIATDEECTPIKQDEKKGQLREFKTGAAGLFFNYGCFPQTWEDPSHFHEGCDVGGDNDPLDVCEIGMRQIGVGEVQTVKVLGVLAMIDEGEMDWKVIAIASDDPWAEFLNDVSDLERLVPGMISSIREWFRNYKVADGKPQNNFAFEERCLDKAFAHDVITECHGAWYNLLQRKHEPHEKAEKLDTKHRPSMLALTPAQLHELQQRHQKGCANSKLNENIIDEKD
ncbi:Inorganic pyrophosphatase (Pyrophosphate phospho-hydrolase) (PPase), partial [Durusdinium trenchii]